MKNDLYWEIPSSVDLEGFLKKHPPGFKYKIDHFYYIIDYLTRGMDAMEDLDDNAGFVNMNAQRLQKVNHNYKKYMDHLLKHWFIRTDMKYVVGKKSKGYHLDLNCGNQYTTKRIPIIDLIIHRHKLKEVNEQKAIVEATRKQYPHLTKWFNHLQIDREEAIYSLENLFPIKTSGIRGTRKGKASNSAKRIRTIMAINKIADKEFYYSVDENVGRFHSTLTNLKKEIRNYITYNGQRLVNVDIKNSQPLFSTLLLNKDFYSQNGLFNISNIPLYSSLLSNNKHSYSTISIMLVKTLKKSHIQDISTYIDLVNSGSFYENISKLLYPTEEFIKEKVKPMVFMIMYSRNNYMGQPKAEPKKRFKKMFPRTYEIFRILKLCDHTALSRILQRIESNIMIQNVVPRITRERPDLPIFTIHDSVVTTVGNEEYVSSIIQEEVFRLTGLKALLGKEYWG